MADYTENLLNAVQIVVDEAIKKVKYDKTILCSIVSIDNDAGDEYTVSSGSTKFTAFGDAGYKIDTNVYVLIPNGDYNNKCLIVGRYVSSDTQSFSYVSPMDSFLQLTGNLYNGGEGSLLANGDTQEILLRSFSIPDNVSIGYDRLGISADFKTGLTQYNIISGSYGLRLDVGWEEKSSSNNTIQKHRSNIYLDTADMWGNPYNYNTYFTQEKVFDISKISKLTDVNVYFYQNKDFINSNNELIPHSATLGEEEVLYLDNLFVRSIIISLGHSLDELTEDKVYLYTTDSNNYNQTTSLNNAHTAGTLSVKGIARAGNDKNVHLRWVHKIDDNTFKSIDEEDEIPTNCHVHWYKYTLDKDVTDSIAGMFWEEITPNNDKILNAIFTPDAANQNELLKAVIVEIDEDALAKITNDDYADLDENYSDKKLAAQKEALATAQSELENKNSEKVNYDKQMQLGNPVDANIYDALVTAIAKLKKTISDTQKIIDNWDTNKSSAIREKAQTWYESETLTFLNTDTVANKATINLVRGVSIEALDTYNGVYKLYDPLTAYLTNTIEASKTRKLQVSFTSIITGTAELDKAETIKWYIPKNNTMIQTPEDGIEFNTEEGDIFDASNEQYYIITRQFAGDLVEASTGKLVDRSAMQCYRIEKYFNENKNNNTIKCEVIRNTVSYIASKELAFGLSGSNGRNATLILSMGDDYDSNNNLIETKVPAWTANSTTFGDGSVMPATSSLILNAQIYDYNNQPLTITSCQWGYEQPSDTTSQPFAITQVNTTQYRLTLKDSGLLNNFADVNSAESFKGCVLSCRVTANGKSYSGYLSIPVRLNRLYKYLEGATSVIYNSQGASPSYYKDYYQVYNNLEQPFNNIEVVRRDNWLSDAQKKWLPSIKVTDGHYYLLPNNLYVGNIDYSCVIAVKYNNQFVWKQPVLITQNRYTSPMLNEWDGNFVLDEENNTLLSAMLGAGVKNSDNTFSGVLVGQVGKADSSASKTGVYGYDHGEVAYALREDGTATIGKASTAQLVFDGKTGTIYNKGYNSTKATGIKLFLDGDSDNEQYFSLKSGGNEYVRLSTKGSYLKIKGSDGRTRLEVNDSATTIGGWTINESSITGGNTILDKNGNITTTQLYASGGTIGGWTITQTTISGGNTTLNSNGNVSTSNLYANGGTIGGWTINNDSISGGGTTLNKDGSISTNQLYASGGTIGGWTITGSSISGGGATISSGGTISGATISGGTIKGSNLQIYHGSGYLLWENGNTNPSVSGLNVGTAGIANKGAMSTGELWLNGQIYADKDNNIMGQTYSDGIKVLRDIEFGSYSITVRGTGTTTPTLTIPTVDSKSYWTLRVTKGLITGVSSS